MDCMRAIVVKLFHGENEAIEKRTRVKHTQVSNMFFGALNSKVGFEFQYRRKRNVKGEIFREVMAFTIFQKKCLCFRIIHRHIFLLLVIFLSLSLIFFTWLLLYRLLLLLHTLFSWLLLLLYTLFSWLLLLLHTLFF